MKKIFKHITISAMVFLLALTGVSVPVNADEIKEVYTNDEQTVAITVDRELIDEEVKLEFKAEHESSIEINDVLYEGESIQNGHLITHIVGENGNYKYVVEYTEAVLIENENEEAEEVLEKLTFSFEVEVDEFSVKNETQNIKDVETEEDTLDFFVPATGEVISLTEEDINTKVNEGTMSITPFSIGQTGKFTTPNNFQGEYKIDSNSGGWRGTHFSWGVSYIDGHVAYCLDPTRQAAQGNTYTSHTFYDSLPDLQQDQIWLIAYFGYGFEGDTNYHRYLAAQELIWEQMTINQVRGYGGNEKFAISWTGKDGENISTINNYKTQINNLKSTYYNRPSFHNTTHNFKIGDVITLTDTNGVLQRFKVVLPSGLELVSNSGNTLRVRVTSNAVDGKEITFVKKHQPSATSSVSWGYGTSQDVFTAGRDKHDPLDSWVTFNLASGNLELTKRNHQGGALSGVVYDFSFNADMSSPFATRTTNAQGIINLSDIEGGTTVYYREKATVAPYVLDTQIYSVNITSGETARVTRTNNPAQGRITLTKVDDHNNVLSGVTFEVRNSSGSVVDTITTNSEGVATSTVLPLGTYTVVETSVGTNTGVVIDSTPITVTLSYANQTTPVVTSAVTVSNEYQRSNVTITKVENDWDETFTQFNGIKLSDAIIELYAKSDIYEGSTLIYSADELIGSETTNTEGVVTFNNLPLGQYYAKEVKSPEGYVLYEGEWDITITMGSPTATLTNTNKTVTNQVIYGKARLTKTDGYRTLLPDAEFGIYAEDGELIETLVTDANGVIETSELRYGNYYFMEHQAPYGYWTDGTPLPFTIREHEETVHVTMSNALIQVHIEWSKTNEDGLPLEGVGFVIRDVNTGEFVTLAHADGKNIVEEDVWFTDANGEVFTKGLITAGEYELVEVQPLPGYREIEPIPFTIDENQDYVDLGSLIGFSLELGEIVNYWNRGDLKIMKVDIDTQAPLEGFVFNLYDWNNELVGTYTTGDDGTVTIENLRYGLYTVEEIEVGSDYGIDVDNNTQSIFVEEDTTVYNVTFENKHADVKTTASFVERDEKEPNMVTIVDVVSYTDLWIGKEYTVTGFLMDKETNDPIIIDGEKVTGSTTFTPNEKDGTVEVNFTFDQNKLETKTIVVFEDLYRDEKLVVTHHDINDLDQTVEIPEIGTTASFVERNKQEPSIVTIRDEVRYSGLVIGKEYRVEGHLMDKETNEPILIDGELISSSTTFVAESTSGSVYLDFTFDQNKLISEAIVVFESLYEGTRLIAVHADIEDVDQTVEVITIQIHKKDSVTGEILKDAEFTMYDLEGNEIDVQITDENGTATFKVFYGEVVELKETAAPVGYILSEEVVTVDTTQIEDGTLFEVEYFNDMLPEEVLPATGDGGSIYNILAVLIIALGIVLIAKETNVFRFVNPSSLKSDISINKDEKNIAQNFMEKRDGDKHDKKIE